MKALTKTNTKTSLKNAVVVILFHLALGQALFAATTDKDFILDKSAPDGAGIVFKSSAHPGSRFWEIDNTSGRFRIFETGGAVNALSILPTTGNVGIGTSAPDKILEINSSSGGNIRLTYGDSDGTAQNYADFQVASNGALSITTVDGTGTAGSIALNPDGNLFIYLIDDIADALDIQQGVNNNYININTTDSSEAITFGNAFANLKYDFIGQVDSGKINTGGAIELGVLATGNRFSYIDFHADDTTEDYGLRVIRNSGINGTSDILSKGTGGINIITEDEAPIVLKTDNTERMKIGAAGDLTITGNLIPAANNTYSLGSDTKRWKELHVASGTIYIGGTALTNNGGQLEWAGTGGIESTSTSMGSLFVENTGTGNSLLVNDDTSDGTPFVIDADGNVGIGTTAPSCLLDVSDNITAPTMQVSTSLAGGNPRVLVTNTDNSNIASHATLQLMNGGASGGDTQIWFDNSTGAGTSWALGSDNSDADKFKLSQSFALGTTDRLVVDSSGKVGIGLTDPDAKLHVKQGSNTLSQPAGNWAAQIANSIDGSDQHGLSVSGRYGAANIKIFEVAKHWGGSGEGYYPIFYVDGGANMYWKQGNAAQGTTLMSWVASTGNVGIGTTTPKALLHVGDNHQVLLATGGNAWVNSSVIETGFTAGIDDWTDILVPGSLTNTARLRLTKAGNVGIGTTAPSATLDIRGVIHISESMELAPEDTGDRTTFIDLNSSNGMDYSSRIIRWAGVNGLTDITATGTGGINITTENAAAIVLKTSNTERMIINSAGNVGIGGKVGIGTTAPGAPLHVKTANNSTALFVENSEGTAGKRKFSFYPNDATLLLSAFDDAGQWVRTMMTFAHDGNVGIGTTVPNELLAINVPATKSEGIEFRENNDSAYGAKIKYDEDKDILTLAGNENTVEKLGISIARATGKVGIGTALPAYKLDVEGSESTDYIARIRNTNTGANTRGLEIQLGIADTLGTNAFMDFTNGSGASQGMIRGVSGTNQITYSTSSDERLKANIRDTRYGLSDLMNVEVRDYEWRSGGFTGTGFIAQELYEVFPMAVSVGSDDVKEQPWGVDYGKLTPLIVIATQEQQEQIEELRGENAELRRLVERMNTRLTRLEWGWQRTPLE